MLLFLMISLMYTIHSVLMMSPIARSLAAVHYSQRFDDVPLARALAAVHY